MPNIDKIRNYAERDVTLIGTVVVGFTKMACNIVNAPAKVHYQSHTHQEIKQLVWSYMLWNLPSILDNKSMIRPSDIREKLPEEWKIIQYADLTDILNSFISNGVFERVTVHEDVKRHKWGRPKKNNDKGPSGPKSFYKPTEYYNNLRNIANDPRMADLIFSLLSESGMLYKLIKQEHIVAFLIIKKNDRKKAWNILRTRNFTIFKSERQYIADFNKIKNKGYKELESLAEKNARVSTQNSSAEGYRDLLVAGGLFFRS